MSIHRVGMAKSHPETGFFMIYAGKSSNTVVIGRVGRLPGLFSRTSAQKQISRQSEGPHFISKAVSEDYRSVDNRIYNRKPLVEREQLFIKYKGDLLTLHNGRERSAFDGLVESILWKLDCNLVRVSDDWPLSHCCNIWQIMTNNSVSFLPQRCTPRLPTKRFITISGLGSTSSPASSSRA